jgi:predicted RNase H-like HicB family nuclease
MYKAMYKIDDDGVHAEVLDFPGAISCGRDLADARSMLQDALVLVAESILEDGKPLPTPDPTATSDDSDIEEPIYLLLSATARVAVIPQDVPA